MIYECCVNDTINAYVESYECEHGWNVGELLIMNYYNAITLSCVLQEGEISEELMNVWEYVLSEDWVGWIVFTDV